MAAADIVYAAHLAIVVFTLTGPFLTSPKMQVLHAWFCVCLLFHWLIHDNKCSLSITESLLRGRPYTETFMHRIVGPVYDISETKLSTLCYVATIIVLCMSLSNISHLFV